MGWGSSVGVSSGGCGFEPGSVVEGPLWSEPVRIISCRPIGGNFELQGVGVFSQKFYHQILSAQQLGFLRPYYRLRDFSGDAEGFFLALEGVRIRYAFQFDPLYAVNVSQIDPLPHQIDAVYNYVLKRPRVRFLLADDPGAGKTIMAGLVLKELKLRGLVERVLIVVPGHLIDQWRRELKEKFGETFMVVDRDVVENSWGRNIWRDQAQVITSIDFAKQEDVLLGLSEATWDLVVVDEAHKMAAYRYGNKTEKTDRYRLGEVLSAKSKFLLFLTATPHRGDPENFRLLLDLLEPGLFANKDLVERSIRDGDNPLFLRRLKEDLKDFHGRPLFPPRKVITVKYELSAEEKELYDRVTEYVERYYNKAIEKAVEDKRKRNVAFALLILQRRLASSVRAAKMSLERRRDRLKRLLEMNRFLQEKPVGMDEEALEDLPERERWRRENEMLEMLTSADTQVELEDEISVLDGLVRLAERVEAREVETKLLELKKVMDSIGGEKLLIFTESKDTLDYLVEKISGWGYTVTQIHGGMNLDERIRAEREFREHAQVMVSTEAGGEGVNLQFCRLMINYDIPWNPNRLEQRMGRIHRYGQKYEVNIYNLVAVNTREGQILEKLFEKLEIIRRQLGSDRVFDVIGDVFAGESLEDLIVEAVTNRRSLDEIIGRIEGLPDEEVIRRVREATQESLAKRYIDLASILEESRVAKENRLIPEYIERFFLRASEKLGLKVEKRRDGFYRVINVPYEIRNLPYEFKTKFGEVFREYGKICFDKQMAREGQAEFVAPGHPLLEAVVEKVLKAYGESLERGAVFFDPSGKMNGYIWFLEGEVSDGTGSVAGKRIFALYQDVGGDVRQVSPSILWDLKPGRAPQVDMAWQPDEKAIVEYAVENVLSRYLDELREQRVHDVEIKRKYGLESLNWLIGQSQAKLIEYYIKRANGEDIPEATIINEERNKEELERRKELLQKQLELEVNLTPHYPRIIGVLAVLPEATVDDTLKEDEQIEEIGMRVAIEFERAQGRSPQDVSTQNLGYDILSRAPDGTVRHIEVKARRGEGAVALTPNEWIMAQRLRDEYWLYIVANAATKPELYTVQNPAEKLKPREEVEVVRYVVADWKAAASKQQI